MPSAEDIKNVSRAAKELKSAAGNISKGFSILKRIFSGKNSRISTETGLYMVGVAFFLDLLALLGLIPIVGWIASPVVYVLSLVIFWAWFKQHKVNFFSSRTAASKIITGILEFFPEVEAFVPGVLVNVVVAIAIVRLEDIGLENPQGAGAAADSSTKTGKRGGETRADNVLNNKRTPEERAERFRVGRKQDTSTPQAPGADTNPYLTPQVQTPKAANTELSQGADRSNMSDVDVVREYRKRFGRNAGEGVPVDSMKKWLAEADKNKANTELVRGMDPSIGKHGEVSLDTIRKYKAEAQRRMQDQGQANTDLSNPQGEEKAA